MRTNPCMESANEFNHVGTPVENPMETRKKKMETALITGLFELMKRNIVADATRGRAAGAQVTGLSALAGRFSLSTAGTSISLYLCSSFQTSS